MSASVKLSDLIDGFDWVSAGYLFENSAYIDKITGKIYFETDSVEFEEEQPDSFEDESIYLAIPHKNDLDLGRTIVFEYIDEFLPESANTVREFFRKKGAYSKFKELLERRKHLELWYKFEEEAIEIALREWAKNHNIHIYVD